MLGCGRSGFGGGLRLRVLGWLVWALWARVVGRVVRGVEGWGRRMVRLVGRCLSVSGLVWSGELAGLVGLVSWFVATRSF